MNIDKAQLIPYLKGLAEGYADQPGMQWSDYHVANMLSSVMERIEAGEFDEVDEEKYFGIEDDEK